MDGEGHDEQQPRRNGLNALADGDL